MKSKNFKSVIHNFTHSLQSIDYTRCSYPIFYELIKLNSINELDTVEFDFINKSIHPKKAINNNTLKILEDYKDWLPKLCESQNCDVSYIEALSVKIFIDFTSISKPIKMKTTFQIKTYSHTTYKIKDKKIKYIDLAFNEWIEKSGLSSHIITTYLKD